LDAVLDGHNHPDVARTLAGFLDAHPDYPPRLRAKILQAADGVWRAVAIVHGPEALPGRLGGT
jgi:aminopeptidase N